MTPGRVAFTTSASAVALGAVLLSAAFWAPMYNDGGTLVDVNGYGVLIPVAAPLVLATAAFLALWARCARGSRVGNAVANVVLALLIGLTLLGAATIGILVLPITALVAVAVATTPQYS